MGGALFSDIWSVGPSEGSLSVYGQHLAVWQSQVCRQTSSAGSPLADGGSGRGTETSRAPWAQGACNDEDTHAPKARNVMAPTDQHCTMRL